MYINDLLLSGLNPLFINKASNFINIGERTNVTGSKKFARLIREKKYDEAIRIAREQIENGAQIIDVNMDDALLDSELCMVEFLNLLQSEPDIAMVPVMIDSSKFSVIEAGLRCVQGKCMVNSISLKEGEEKFVAHAQTCMDYGAAVVVMCFDEQGQADNLARRKEIVERAYTILTQRVGFLPQDIVFDLNIFAVATGIEAHQTYALDFIEATRWVKGKYPLVKVSGGVSNLSFSFRGNEALRQAMHSIFLYYAIQGGMDMGIVNAGQLSVYDDIPQELKILIENVLFNKTPDATEQLTEYANTMQQDKSQQQVQQSVWRSNPVEERLKHALVHGIVDYVEEDTKGCLEKYQSPLAVIDQVLMAGMNTVGDLFGSGKMFLPQVVKSARVMKRSVAFLEPYILASKVEAVQKKKILLATVKGDVHDIGKNIVGVVLSCNGYEIIDLGVMVPAQTILENVRLHHPDLIGLSGLITPSLDEMIDVVKLLKQEGITIPVMIGGATTSRLHTALKISPHYPYGIVHVLDASRSVQVANRLINPDTKPQFLKNIEEEYETLRNNFETQNSYKKYLSLSEAQHNRWQYDWSTYTPPQPAYIAVKQLLNYQLKEIAEYIHWKPFFMLWKMNGNYPEILQNKEAKKVFDDAQIILQKIITNNLLEAHASIGFWRVKKEGDDLWLVDEKIRLCFLRQQVEKAKNQPNLCLSDFIADNKEDYIGGFVATMQGIEKVLPQFEDDYEQIIAQALADRLVEAFAELLHKQVRTLYWGYDKQENLNKDELIAEKYTGIRPAIGYPACPDHTEKEKLFSLLSTTHYTGIRLTENFAMYPAASVCGWYFSHPESHYFGVGKINDNQVEDYAHRKDMSIAEMQKWLQVNRVE